jgi:serine/threonine protein kinase
VTDRLWFAVCRFLGAVLRRARYAETQMVDEVSERVVHKQRTPFAPLLVWLSGPVVRWLDTGVRVLPQDEWEEKERLMYRTLHDVAIRVEGKTLVLPRLPGRTLAALLEDGSVNDAARQTGIALAAEALAGLHHRGLSHGDAMAENVLVDLDGCVARWIDFETVHDDSRGFDWRKADDVRALLATSVLRTERSQRAEIVKLVLDRYGDRSILPTLGAFFTPGLKRSLIFHLGQAALSFEDYRELARAI